MRPKLLDLFCGAGGAAAGYYRAGFDVVGVDIKPQKRFPYEFHQADAMHVLRTLVDGGSWEGYTLRDFAAIHASPECQEYSTTRAFRKITHTNNVKPMLIAPVLTLLRASGLPWVLENVPGAIADLPNAIELCGASFGLPLLRHRLFLSSELLFAPYHRKHPASFYNVAGGKVRAYGAHRHKNKPYRTAGGQIQYREACCRKEVGQQAMGIDWMTVAEMSQAIPPAYTEFLGQQLRSLLERPAVV